jgi:hypothetical protein
VYAEVAAWPETLDLPLRNANERKPSSSGASESRTSSGRKDRKGTTGSDQADGDPDIAHIKLGPQPPADWQIEES